MKRITKAKARELYGKGREIYLIPSKIRMGAMGYPIGVNKQSSETDFEKCINNFYYYNCNEETGKVIHYYIKEN